MQLTVGTVVGVVGSGTMGAGIAQVAASAGHRVLLFDTAAGRAQAAVDGVGARLLRSVEQGKVTAPDAACVAQRLVAITDVGDMAQCGVVIEAAVESLSIKQEIFAEVEAVVSESCVLATNTSSLSITAVAATLRHPERCVGMHFFNPAPVMKLVEVVCGLATDPTLAVEIAALAASWGKTPVAVASTPGFIVNRVARPFYGESLRALQERAADAATIDAVLRDCGGFRMGPLELTDLIGQDVNLAVSTSVWVLFGHDPRYAPSLAQQQLVDAGRLGRKTGHGFYRYGDGVCPAQPTTAAPAPAPTEVTSTGDWSWWKPLWHRVPQSTTRISGGGADEGGPRVTLPSGAWLVPTDGRTATERSADANRPVITMDYLLDPATATRVAVAASDGAPAAALQEAVGLLQATGAAVTVLDDLPGLLVARTVAMLVNEAVDVVGLGVATAGDVDVAMRLGVGYPIGPLEWGDRIGAPAVVAVLDAMSRAYPEGRYRACPWLRRAAWSGRSLHA